MNQVLFLNQVFYVVIIDVVGDAIGLHHYTKLSFMSFAGHLKFWKKKAIGIEFAKHFRSHLGPIEGLAVGALFYLLFDNIAIK